MKLKELIAQNSAVSKFSYAFYKAKPGICVAAGLTGTAIAVYLAWNAGRKTSEVLEEVKNDISKVKAQRPKEVTDAPTGKTFYVVEEGQMEKSEYNRALVKVFMTAGIKFGKIFAPAAIAEAVSIITVAHGYGLLNERFVATAQLAQAYAACLTAYRGRVKDKYGEDEERRLYYGIKEEIIEEPELDKNGEVKKTKDGKVKVIKTKKEVLDEELAKHSPFARVFDAEYSAEFETDKETGLENVWYNGKLLKDVERMFNEIIKYAKYNIIPANEIYEQLGMDQTGHGQIDGYHGHWENGEFIFDIGDPEGIKFYLFPVYYHDDETGGLKRSYIFDLNLDPVKNNILGFFPETQRTVKEINGQT